MNEPGPKPIPTVPPRLGLAIASLVLGITAFLFSLFVVGAFFGLLGLVLGWVHISGKRGPNAMAWWGISLSIVGIAASIAMSVYYFRVFKDVYKSFASMATTMQAPETSEWEGVLAPDLTLTSLDGKTVHLSELRGKRVVLDFWATWCGPCVQEIPHLVKLHNETTRDQLEIIGISAEPPAILRPFVNKKMIKYPIVSASGLPAPYSDPPSLPTTFFIDRKGVIQSVVVGYHDFTKLKSLALAEDFSGEPKATPETPPADLKEPEKLLTAVEVWSNNIPKASALCSGDWDGDGRLDILVADSAKKLHVLGSDGVQKLTLALPESFSVIECGKHNQKGARLLGYSHWGRKISVLDVTGKEIWQYSASFGTDGAHWGDLDGDGTDEMLVGMNGLGGMHAVNSEGKKIWQAGGMNVWGQALVPAATNRQPVVFSTDATGAVRIFDGKGTLLRTARPEGEYCTQLAAAVMNREGFVEALVLGQSRVICIHSDGHVAWSAPCSLNSAPQQVTFSAGDVDNDGTKEWAFVDSANNLVLASPTGEKRASVPGFSTVTSLCFVPDPTGRNLLLTLRGGVLKAYRFE